MSPEQLQFFKDNGYLVIKNLIDFDTLYSYKKRFSQICNGIVPPGNINVVKDRKLMAISKKPEDYVNKLQDLFFDDVYGRYVEHEKLMKAITQFLGENITAMHLMFINKPPGTPEHPPHQDMYYFPLRPADKVLAAWTAVDEVTVDNGCLYVIPGSHKAGLHAHVHTSILYHKIIDPTIGAEHERVNLEMSPGDTVFFHPELIHGSRPNTSKNYRKAIVCHFADSNVEYIDVKGTVQEEMAKEVVAEANRRGLNDITIQDVWRLGSKIVKEAPSKL